MNDALSFQGCLKLCDLDTTSAVIQYPSFALLPVLLISSLRRFLPLTLLMLLFSCLRLGAKLVPLELEKKMNVIFMCLSCILLDLNEISTEA